MAINKQKQRETEKELAENLILVLILAFDSKKGQKGDKIST